MGQTKVPVFNSGQKHTSKVAHTTENRRQYFSKRFRSHQKCTPQVFKMGYFST